MSCHACMHHMHINTSSEMLNAEFIFKGQKKYMGDQWEARLSAMENAQEKIDQ